MLAGLATYLSGYRHLPARVPKRTDESGTLSSAHWRVILALSAVLIITILASGSAVATACARGGARGNGISAQR